MTLSSHFGTCLAPAGKCALKRAVCSLSFANKAQPFALARVIIINVDYQSTLMQDPEQNSHGLPCRARKTRYAMPKERRILARMTDEQIAALRANAAALDTEAVDLARAVARFDMTTNVALREEADAVLMAVDSRGVLRVKAQFYRWVNHRDQYFRAIDALVHKHFTNVAHAESVATSAHDKLLHLDALASVGMKTCNAILEVNSRTLRAFHKYKPNTFIFRVDGETSESFSRNCAKLGVSKSDYVRGFCVPGIDDAAVLEEYFDARLVYVDRASLPELVELVRSTGYLFDDALHDMNTIRAAESMSYYRAVELCEHADRKLGQAAARYMDIWKKLDGLGADMLDGFVVLPMPRRTKKGA